MLDQTRFQQFYKAHMRDRRLGLFKRNLPTSTIRKRRFTPWSEPNRIEHFLKKVSIHCPVQEGLSLQRSKRLFFDRDVTPKSVTKKTRTIRFTIRSAKVRNAARCRYSGTCSPKKTKQ